MKNDLVFVGIEDSRRGVSKELSEGPKNDLLFETIEDLIDDVILGTSEVPEGDVVFSDAEGFDGSVLKNAVEDFEDSCSDLDGSSVGFV